MRKILCMLSLAATLISVAPTTNVAQAADQGPGSFKFPATGVVPCGAACAYNHPVDIGYEECTSPFPQGSFVDVVTTAAPTPPSGHKYVLQLKAFPVVDWDTFICEMGTGGSHNGALLAAGSNMTGENCDNVVGSNNPVPVGCQEVAQAPAKAGKRYVLRAYNFSDAVDCPASYAWILV